MISYLNLKSLNNILVILMILKNVIVGTLNIAISLVVIISVLTGTYITFYFQTLAFATVTEQQFTAKLFGDMEVPPT
jgi:hypothetical protein